MSEYTIKDIQNIDLKILVDFRNICEKYGLTYWLSSGTLLGAIRHKGFIPWDDDVDVEMPIEDYKKFCKVAQKEFGDKYFLQTYKTEKLYDMQFAKIRANNTTSMPINRKGWNIHWGVCIDIFPVIGLYDNRVLQKIQKELINVNTYLLCADRNHFTEENTNIKYKLLYMIPNRIRHLICDINNVFLLKNFRASKTGMMLWSGVPQVWTKDNCKESVLVPFESERFSVPIGYDNILKGLYGDYMKLPPENEREGHTLLLGDIIFDLEKNYTNYL